MKKINFDSTDITQNVLLSLTKKSFFYMQDSYTEMVIALAKEKVGIYSDNVFYCLWGCDNVTTNKINEGLILYNNELYFTDEYYFSVVQGSAVPFYIETYNKTLEDLNNGVLTDGTTNINEYNEKRIRFTDNNTSFPFSSIVYLGDFNNNGSLNLIDNTLDFKNNTTNKYYLINSDFTIYLKDSTQNLGSYYKEINIYVYNNSANSVTATISNSTGSDAIPTNKLNNFSFDIAVSITSGNLQTFKFIKLGSGAGVPLPYIKL